MFFILTVEMRSSMQIDRQKLEQQHSTNQKLDQEMASRQQQKKQHNKELQEKLGQAEKDLSKHQEINIEFEQKVAELRLLTDNVQVESGCFLEI